MRSPYSNYFAFTRTQADSSQGLFLGEHIGGGSGASPPLVRIGDKFASVDGQAETYSSLSTSPSNRYLVASTTVIVVGSQPSMDFDNSVYELKSGNFLKMVNEQTVFGALSALDQSTPEAISARNKLSPAYEAWQQGQIAQTTDPAFLAALEHDTFIIPPYPDFMQTVGPVWSDRDNFYLGYKVDLVSLLGFSGSDTFVFEFDVEGHILSCSSWYLI